MKHKDVNTSDEALFIAADFSGHSNLETFDPTQRLLSFAAYCVRLLHVIVCIPISSAAKTEQRWR